MRKWSSTLLLLILLVTAHAATAQVQVVSAYVYGPSGTRVATFPTGNQIVGTLFAVQGLPANSTWKLSYFGPGGSLSATASGSYNNSAPLPNIAIPLAPSRLLSLTKGDWHIQLAINGQPAKDLYFAAGLGAPVLDHALVISQDFFTEQTKFDVGNNLIGSTAWLKNIPAGTWVNLRYQRPDGTIAADNTWDPQGSVSYDGFIGARWFVNLDQPGTWQLIFNLSGKLLTAEKFYVGKTPVGVDVDNRGGYGLTFGDVLRSEPGTAPLHATLSLHSDLKLWLGVTDIQTANGTTITANQDTLARIALAKLSLIAPSVSPVYDAHFPIVGSSVTMRVNMTPLAAELNILDILLQFAEAPVTADDIASDLDDVVSILAQSDTILKVAAHFSPWPTSRGAWLQATAAAAYDLAKLKGADTALLKKLVETVTHGKYTLNVERYEQLGNQYNTLNFLYHAIADEATLIFGTGGKDMIVTFTGSTIRN